MGEREGSDSERVEPHPHCGMCGGTGVYEPVFYEEYDGPRECPCTLPTGSEQEDPR